MLLIFNILLYICHYDDDNDVCVCVCVYSVIHVPWHTCGSPKMMLESQFSPSTLIWAPGSKLRMLGFPSKCCCPESPHWSSLAILVTVANYIPNNVINSKQHQRQLFKLTNGTSSETGENKDHCIFPKQLNNLDSNLN